MDKIDFKKKYKNLYVPSNKTPSIVKVPSFNYAVIDGEGNPNNEPFSKAIEALFGFAYTVSMSYKGDDLVIPNFYNFVVPPLEGVWDLIEGKEFSKDNFKWTIGIMQPEFVTDDIFNRAKEVAVTKKKNTQINDIKLRSFNGSTCCTMMHIGSYDDEPATFDKMHEYIKNEGYTRTEKAHREIYLSDFRKVAPEKLKTVLRFKVKKD